MEVGFEGEYDRRTLAAALRTMGARWWRLPLYGAALGVLAVALAGGGERAPLALAGLVVFALAVVAQLWWMPRSQAGRLLDGPAFAGRQIGRAHADGIEVRSPHIESSTGWSAFTHHRITDDLVLLHHAAPLAVVLPRAFFATGADWDRFVELVRANVPSGGDRPS